jgi:hypothetical protein
VTRAPEAPPDDAVARDRLAREARHQLANDLAGIVTALVVLERDLDPDSATPRETLRAARTQCGEILGVGRKALRLAHPAAK